MPKRAEHIDSISEILVNPQPRGMRAVYLVETRTPQEAKEIDKLFGELASQIQVRQLCKGTLVSYAVQADESDIALLDEIENLLKQTYAFVVAQHSFDDLICRIVKELCLDTQSKLIPMPTCNICGKTEPFPALLVNLTDEEGKIVFARNYCSNCAAVASAPSNKEFIRSLLAADERDFSKLEQAELVRHPSRKQPIRFRIKSGQL